MRRPSSTVLALTAAAFAPAAVAQNASAQNPAPPSAAVDTAGLNMNAATAGDEQRPAAASERPTPTPASPSLLDRIGSMFAIHGYFRTRPEWMHNFALGWDNPDFLGGSVTYGNSQLPWTRTPDNGLPNLCVGDPGNRCTSSNQSMANMRFRLNPEIHVTDNIAIYSQIDILDNLILGSTPQGYYTRGTASPWSPITAFSTTQVTPTDQNSMTPSIMVSRAWAEVTHPSLGQIRFGRMPGQWGLGILANAGNGIDSDYQTHVDRLMYAARIRSINLFAAAFYDFASTGATSGSYAREAGQGQPIDVSQLDDVHQYGLAVGHRYEPAEARQRLAHGSLVINGGVEALYRNQNMTSEYAGVSTTTNADQIGVGTNTANLQAGMSHRGAWAVVTDGWFQMLHRNFRLEVEAAFIYGSTSIALAPADLGNNQYTIAQFGGALEFEYRLLNNRLAIEFRTGYASGDSNVEGLNYQNGFTPPRTASATTLSTFSFHPDYRIDMILWRQIFRQLSGAYYFRPGVSYAFINTPGGDRLYGRVGAIWSRASQFVQTRGNSADLGIELNAELTYQSNFRDTTLGDRAGAGFYGSAQFGVLFPMAGLGPREDERATPAYSSFSFNTAMTVRGILGVRF